MTKYPIESELKPRIAVKSTPMHMPRGPVPVVTITETPMGILKGKRREDKPLKKLRYVAAAFILFNLLYAAVLFIIANAFARLFWDLSISFILYGFSLACALLGVALKRGKLLLPVMIATIPIIAVGFMGGCYYLSNAFYCTLTRHSQSSLHYFHPFTLQSTSKEKVIVGNNEMDEAVRENFWSKPVYGYYFVATLFHLF